MGLAEERVALRGEEVMKEIVFMHNDGIERDSRMVTPLGICMSYYASNNNFIFVNFNGQQIKLYDNGKLAIGDAAMQVDFPNEDLFPKRGKDLVFTINGKERIVRGKPGESAEILLNGQPADIHALLHGNDIIEVRKSTTGPAASMDIESLPEFKSNFKVNVNGQDVEASRIANVNGSLQSGFYGIKPGDDVKILDYDTAEQIAALLDIEITPDTVIIVNNEIADRETPVYENFKVEFKKQEDVITEYYHDFPGSDEGYDDTYDAPVKNEARTEMPFKPVYREPESDEKREEPLIWDIADEVQKAAMNDPAFSNTGNTNGGMRELHAPSADEGGDLLSDYQELQQLQPDEPEEAAEPEEEQGDPLTTIEVEVNGEPIVMTGKSEYIFVDIFDYINFDLQDSKGRGIVTQVNGASPDYMQALSDGDKIEIYWKEG